jgi:hypothetical protein
MSDLIIRTENLSRQNNIGVTGASFIDTMHGGLLPIVSYESAVNAEDLVVC